MPTEIRIWLVEQDRPVPVQQQKLNLESRIENWIKHDISLINDALLVIGQQITTAYGGVIDLLALDSTGNLVILELKRDKTPRDIVAQVLDYASWVETLTHDEIGAIAGAFLKPNSLESAFQSKFNAELPEVLNERHRMYIVASVLDPATERIIKYLSESHNVDINAATFSYFMTPQGELLGRSFLLDDEQVQVRAETTSKRQPPRSWEELRELAENHGVPQLYDDALEGLRPLFDGANRTRANVALVGTMGQNKARNTILSIYPQASSEKLGLAILIFIERVRDYFALPEADIKNVIGNPNVQADIWDPQNTYFFDAAKLSAFIDMLYRAKNN